MKTKKNLTLIALMLGVMMIVSVSGLVNATGFCGDGSITCPNGGGVCEQCDSSNLGGATCASVMGVGYTGTLGCTNYISGGNPNNCQFDKSGCVAPTPTCTVTVSEPTSGWYNGNIPIVWSYSDGCQVSTQLIQRKSGSVLQNIKEVGNNDDRTSTWFPTDPLYQEGQFSLCVYAGMYGQVNQIGCSAEFNIDRTAPVITAEDRTCDEGETITLTASATDALSKVNPSSWAWVNASKTSGSDSESSASYTCLNGPATETVSVSVSDNAGNSASKTVTITVNNVAPTVTDITTSGILYEGSSVTLSATATDLSSDGDTPMTFVWDTNNDGTFGDLNVLSCSQNESISVKVKATDSDGATSDEYSEEIVCQNVAPVVNSLVVNPNSIFEEESTTLTATVSDVGADDTTLSYLINWEDGSEVTTGSTSDGTISATHQYMDDDADDKYTITLTVTDTDSESGSNTVEIEVLNKNPWDVDAGADQNTAEDYLVCFDGTATDVAADMPLTYTWDFGNGGSATAIGGSYACTTYSEKGQYTVTMTVTDGDGGSATDNLIVTVYEYAIPLNEGWNLISIPLVPEDTSIDFVFSTILDKVAYDGDDIATILQYDAVLKKWYKARPNAEEPTGFYWASDSKLENVVPGYGYYIKMADDAVLYLNGKKSYLVEGQDTTPVFGVPPSVTLAMDSWNLIGVYGVGDPLVNLALKSLEDEEGNKYYDIIIDKSGGQWYYNTWSTLHSTDGYWISIKKAFGGEQTVEYKSNYAPDWSLLPA